MNWVKEALIEGCSECGGERMIEDGCGVRCEDCKHHRCFLRGA